MRSVCPSRSAVSTWNNQYLGGIQSVKLNRQTTHLVCAIPAGQKYDKSLEWGVSVVRDTWLFAMGRSATIEAEEKHRHDPFHPAMGPSGPKLTGRTGSTSNMSAVSLLNEPMDFARIASVVAPSSSLAPLPKAVSQQSISPSRKLKLTPTHIDGQSFNGVLAPASGSIVAGSTTHPLSPPKPETERLLNNASPHSIDAKLSRMSSAPAGSSPRSKEKRESPVVKAATMGGLTGRKEDMTEVLRQLAQTEQTTPGLRTKIVCPDLADRQCRTDRCVYVSKDGLDRLQGSGYAEKPSLRVRSLTYSADLLAWILAHDNIRLPTLSPFLPHFAARARPA